ncbi:Bax inhibitor-1/YccA family protein [Glaciecola sp. XM2]|uniref:Bax inhibitor-1/YccA family protein n=1 Tax=Glaciecola sp. XM2 TaxID=1914931 RepID=UPI001BDEF9FE|nr:Bax inhibitor-1/YccA family protein [Glaciecola sp. XM2]MBT1449620.1 Bax inhibitor-1/YccA family protein [Glaciecola sp. XM2]
MDRRTMYSTSAESSAIEINKVLRNTYMLLALTIGFSAITATITSMLNIGMVGYFAMIIGAFISLFIVQKKADSASGLVWVFVFTGLIGGAIGPIISMYVAAGAGGLVAQALGATAVVFFTLSGYALVSKKDFSFLGGFLMVGLVVALLAIIANIFFQMQAMSMAINALIIFVMSGLILFDTSRIIHGGETNYIRATVSLYLSIYNIFMSILALLGAGEE